MTDQEIIDKVDLRYAGKEGSNYEGNLYYCTKVLLRYTRWIERAKCEVELDALDKRWSESEDYLTRESSYEVKGLQDEISHWKYKYYELGGRE